MQLSILFRAQLLMLGGETLVMEFENFMNSLQSAWAAEHQIDDSHGNVHALTLSEHGRTVPVGDWITVPYVAGDYTASGAMVWGVDPGDYVSFAYTLIGRTMIVSGVWNATSITAPLSTTLFVKIPGGYVSARRMQTGARVTDNGVGAAAFNQVQKDGTTIEIALASGANWAASVNNTGIRLQLAFEVKVAA